MNKLTTLTQTDYDQKVVDRFSRLQDMAVGYCDVDELTDVGFTITYPNKKALLKEVKHWLDLYLDEDCLQGAERYDSNPRVRKNWANEVARLKRFIAELEK